ncbi:MAG TPA: hypothetical protein VG603_03660, partial [Chitinophagales bacterium]|nr:hypothetical protein [Chitinophagales bacterium]
MVKKIFQNEFFFYLIREVLWLAITAMLTYAVLWPVVSKIDYFYWRINAFYVFLFITYFRYSITFRSLPFFKPAWIRFILFTGNIVLFFFLAQHEQKLLSLMDNFYTEDFGFPKVILFEADKQKLLKYIYKEVT